MRLCSIAAVVCGGFLLNFQMLAQVQGTWSTTTGNLPSALELNTQVLLTNGKVLVAGGSDGSNLLNTAQLYNPNTGLWTPTGSMETARYDFAAVVLKNGQVLVEGGIGPAGAILHTAELYTPSTGKWTSVQEHISVARYGHTATLLPSGEVLVTGGCTSLNCSVTGVSELYHPVVGTTGYWTTITKGGLKLARAHQTATLLPNGKVLVVGGYVDSPTKSTTSCEVYDPKAQTWTIVAPTLVPRYQHAAALLPSSGKVLVSGGYCGLRCAYSSAEIYDPASNKWKPTTGNMTLPYGRFAHTATALANNTVLIAGGFTFQNGYSLSVTPSTEIYDEVAGEFTATGSLNQLRHDQTVSLLRSGQAMVVGGDYTGLSFHPAEIYTPLTLAISPLNLSFPPEKIGLTSTAKTVTVTNVSRTAVAFTGGASVGISASGDFEQTHNCPSSLLAGKSCKISVKFKPTAAGTRNGAVTLKDTSFASPSQAIALSGTGETHAISFTPPFVLTLPAVPLADSPSMASVTVINDGASPVSITITILPVNVFTQTNNCPSMLGVDQTCTINVGFHPSDSITYYGTLQVSDNVLKLTGTRLD